jgi:hypothetical protein
MRNARGGVGSTRGRHGAVQMVGHWMRHRVRLDDEGRWHPTSVGHECTAMANGIAGGDSED